MSSHGAKIVMWSVVGTNENGEQATFANFLHRQFPEDEGSDLRQGEAVVVKS